MKAKVQPIPRSSVAAKLIHALHTDGVSKVEWKFFETLQKRGPLTASLVGERVWGLRLLGSKPQHYARPASNVLKHLRMLGLVRDYFDDVGRHMWEVCT